MDTTPYLLNSQSIDENLIRNSLSKKESESFTLLSQSDETPGKLTTLEFSSKSVFNQLVESTLDCGYDSPQGLKLPTLEYTHSNISIFNNEPLSNLIVTNTAQEDEKNILIEEKQQSFSIELLNNSKKNELKPKDGNTKNSQMTNLLSENSINITTENKKDQNIILSNNDNSIDISISLGGKDFKTEEIYDSEEEKDQFNIDEVVKNLQASIDAEPQKQYLLHMLHQLTTKIEQREQKIKLKEKQIKEQLKSISDMHNKSCSSTQQSNDTYSLGFTRIPKEMQSILNEILGDSQSSIAASGQSNISSSEFDVDFVFLFSAPLVLYYTDHQGIKKKSPIYMQVEYQAELESVKRILSSISKPVRFINFAATQNGLGECLNMKPRSIHFCGHGVKNNQENFGIFTDTSEGDYLIFEDEEGKADYLSCRALKNLLREKKLEQSIDFVFVASCHSSLVGKVFLEAGAKHVICVDHNEKIADLACQKFTKAFYHAYFAGNYTVCESYNIAKEQLRYARELPPGEANKFELLYQEDIYFAHICSTSFNSVPNVKEGENYFKNLTAIPAFNTVPSRVEHFIGRHIETHEVITMVQNQRFVTIKGIPGIGKSSLCKEVSNYLCERNVFKDGIIYLFLNNYDTIEGIFSCLDSKLGYLSKDVKSAKESFGNMISQIANHLKEKIKDVLIVLDNVDEVLSNERARFREFVELLLVSCPNVKVLITSRSPLGGISSSTEKVYNLNNLDATNSKELFLLRSPRNISDFELQELLMYQPTSFEQDYIMTSRPYESLSHVKPKNHVSNINNLHTQLCTPSNDYKAKSLEHHQLLQILGGHPQAISLAAALLLDRTPKELFQLLISKDLIKVLQVEGLNNEEGEAKSIDSLKVSLDVSIKHLLKRNHDAVKFFSVLGLLPGGALNEDFDHIWGKGWLDHASVLLRSSLLVKQLKIGQKNTTRYTLYPFMIKYAEEKLDAKNKKDFSLKILKHLVNKAKEIFNKIGTVSLDSNIYFDIFLQEEPNFKSCILREKNDIIQKFSNNSNCKKNIKITVNETQKIIPSSIGTGTFGLSKSNLDLVNNFHVNRKNALIKISNESMGN